MKYYPLIPLFLLILIGCKNQPPEVDLLISNVSVIDVVSGRISVNQDVSIDDSIIVEIINSDESKLRAKKNINGRGKYLIPSLWDMHVHIQDSAYLEMFLDYGILGVRDMGGCASQPTDGCESLCAEKLNEWKNAISEGTLAGPQLYIAGTQLSGTGWPTSASVSSVIEVRNAFEHNLRNKVDFIKVYEKIPWESYQEIARLSKKYDLDFVGHVSEPFLLSDILDLGQKSIEHIREPILYSFTNDSTVLENFMVADNYTEKDREFVKPWIDDAENVIDAFKRNQAWFTPTMAVQYARSRYRDEKWINHPLREQMPKSVSIGLKKHMARMEKNEDKKGDALWWMALKKLVKRFNDEGIGLLAGSDTACEGGLPGFSLHEELKLMVDAGLSPLNALQTATINPVQFFKMKSAGKVKENYIANLILLDENPLESIENTLKINTVIRNGKIHKNKNNSYNGYK